MSPTPPWVCPEHSAVLSDDADVLTCEHGHGYAIVDGVPRFVGKHTYADAFGAQWLKHRVTQLDRHTERPISRERARRCIGDSAWARLGDATVLEAGCGAGRFTEVLLDEGALVTSVDLSSAVDANAAQFPPSDRHRIAQADITRLPFGSPGFDIVFCLGVIQHTPSPEETIQSLYQHVRPGGFLVIDHYIRSWRAYTRTAPATRFIMRRLSPEAGLRWSERLVDVFRPLHRRATSRWSRVVVNRLSPITSYDDRYPDFADDLLREWAVLDTHDSLTDHFKHRRSVEEIELALHRLGAVDIEVWASGRDGNGVEARCRRA